MVVEHALVEHGAFGRDLNAVNLVLAAVERHQEDFGEVASRAEELHLLAHSHRGDAASDRIVVAVDRAHDVVVLVLNGVGVDRDLCAEVLEALRQALRPQNGDVGLGAAAEVVERLQDAEGRLGDHRSAVLAHAALGRRDPGRIAGEQVVVLGRTQVAHKAQFDDEVVDDLLRGGLVQKPRLDVSLEIDVEESRDSAYGICRAVLFLDRAEIAEIQPLHRLFGVACRTGNVAAVLRRHRFELFHEVELFGQLFELTDVLLAHILHAVFALVALFALDQIVHAVQRDAAVVAYDSAARIGVGQTGDYADVTRCAHLFGVDSEHAVVVRRAVFELRPDLVGHLVAVRVARLLAHSYAGKGIDRPLERRVRLQADDDIEVLVDIAGSVSQDGRHVFGVDVEHALFRLFDKQSVELGGNFLSPFGRSFEERRVSVIGGVVGDNEVSDVDRVAPLALAEALPFFSHKHLLSEAIKYRLGKNFFCCPDGRPAHRELHHGKPCQTVSRTRLSYIALL